jgi:fructose transport system permease protein
LPPFIVTLGTWSIFFALNLWYSGSESIRSQDIAAAADFLQLTGTPIVIGQARITYGSLLMLGLVGLFWYILNWTSFGRHVYAIGDDPEAAQLAGIRTNALLLSVYAIAGLICAIAGWALIGRIGSVSPQSGYTANLDSITAVVIGGTSLFGGRGTAWSALLGALVIGSISNGMDLKAFDSDVKFMVTGAVLLLAVTLDATARRGRRSAGRA